MLTKPQHDCASGSPRREQARPLRAPQVGMPPIAKDAAEFNLASSTIAGEIGPFRSNGGRTILDLLLDRRRRISIGAQFCRPCRTQSWSRSISAMVSASQTPTPIKHGDHRHRDDVHQHAMRIVDVFVFFPLLFVLRQIVEQFGLSSRSRSAAPANGAVAQRAPAAETAKSAPRAERPRPPAGRAPTWSCRLA